MQYRARIERAMTSVAMNRPEASSSTGVQQSTAEYEQRDMMARICHHRLYPLLKVILETHQLHFFLFEDAPAEVRVSNDGFAFCLRANQRHIAKRGARERYTRHSFHKRRRSSVGLLHARRCARVAMATCRIAESQQSLRRLL